jgi:hypothetical protein
MAAYLVITLTAIAARADSPEAANLARLTLPETTHLIAVLALTSTPPPTSWPGADGNTERVRPLGKAATAAATSPS